MSTTWVIVEQCGVDWYYSNLGPSRYKYAHGLFIDTETGKSWRTDDEFHEYLKSIA